MAKKYNDKWLDSTWIELKEIYDDRLKASGVKLHRKGTAQQIWLCVLYDSYKNDPKKYIDKNKIADVVREFKPKLSGDQQIRHLKRSGWNLITCESKKGFHRLDPYKVSPDFEKQTVINSLSLKDFSKIKVKYDSMCATCGGKEGEKHRFYEGKVKLEKGHMDPLERNEKGNIIPQCQYCNRQYKNYFVFDENGRTKAIASIEPVEQASKEVQLKVLEFLKKEHPPK